MNLLQLLLSSMLSNNSVNSVSNKTGISSALVKKLMMLAVPMLIKYMTKNVASASGAQSLLGALAQHKNTRSMAEQIDEADEEDGAKIIGHILGGDKERVVGELAEETGLQSAEVSRGLGAIAPALLSGLAAATAASAAKPQASGLDLSSLMSTFGGAQAQQSSTLGLNDVLSLIGSVQQQQTKPQSNGLLGTLLGGSKPQQQTSSTSNLLGTLLGAQQQQSTPTGLLGSLLGGSQTQQQAQSALDGSDLLNVLSALMR